MVSSLTYDEFSQQSITERIDWIDMLDLQQLKNTYKPSVIKQFFRQLFERESNPYLQLKALESISELTLLNVIRYEFTKDFLLEDALTDNVFIEAARLKYLFLLYGDDQECYTIYEQEAQTADNELAAEACYRAGLIHLLYRSNRTGANAVVDELLLAKQWFDSAQQSVENRIDAHFFGLVSQYFLSLLNLQPDSADALFDELIQVLWERQLWGYLPESDLLEHRVFRSLTKLRAIVKKTAEEEFWTDYKKEFLLLSNCFTELLLSGSLSTRFLNSFEAFTHNPISSVLNSYYTHNLSALQSKIDLIQANADPTEEPLIHFLSDLTVQLNAYREKKNDNSESTIATLCSAFSHVDPPKIIGDVSRLRNEGVDDLMIRAQLAINYAAQMHEDRTNLMTGYQMPEDLLKLLLVRLKGYLPAYPPTKMSIFVGVLSDLLRYAYQAETQNRKLFPHLYDPTVTAEDAFQNHLYMRLTAGERATNYHYEVSNLVGASRLDIVYIENGAVFPIEIKKTDQPPTWESIKQDYIAQVQMYTRSYDQLGFLVVFDISQKRNGKPLTSFHSLVEILNLSAFYNIKEKHPDYVITLIIPGNKIRPSNYTNYR